MPSQFVLRDENTAENPFIARLYGLGITQGKNVLYQTVTNRTVFLSVIMEGSRFRGDLATSKAIKVWYAGFELPEFDATSQRNWKFHKGTIAAAPQYKAITNIDLATNVLTVPTHTYSNGDQIAFWKRGADVSIPVAGFGQLPIQQKFTVGNVSGATFKVLNPSVELDFNGTPVNLSRLFVYKANAWVFDPLQGRPDFFQTLNFTFSGYSYLEVFLPEHLSDGENEPTNLKVMVEGKEMYTITSTAGNVAFTGTVTAEPNNANISADVLVNDGKMPLSRLHGDTWVAWKDRCDGTVGWIAGNDAPAPLASYTLSGGMVYDVPLNKLTHGGAPFTNAYAFTPQLTADFPSMEFKYQGGSMVCTFCLNQIAGDGNQQGARIINGMLNYIHSGFVETAITTIAVGDRVKIAYESGLLKVYKNGVPMPPVSTGQLQLYQTYFGKFVLQEAGQFITEMLIAPSGTSAVPRQIKRFEGAFAAAQPLAAADVFESQLHLSPGCSWADIDGQIRIATEPDRTPCFTFIFDPTDPNVKSNVSKVTVLRKDPKQIPNYYRYTFRDRDDGILARKPAPIDRKERRAAQGGRLIDAGLLPYGVMTQSLIERVGETRARLTSDLTIGFLVEAFGDSITVVKGSFVWLVCPEAGFTQITPARCMVNDIRVTNQDIETVLYELQIITPDFYSDTAHNTPVTPPSNASVTLPFIPPPAALSLSLLETSEPLTDGSLVSSISGVIGFGDGFNQHARVFQKVLLNKIADVTYNFGTNVFTLPAGVTMPAASQPLSIASASNNVPAGYSHDVPYYRVNVSGQTFKLALTEAGTAVAFTTSGEALQLFQYAAWQDTLMDVTPALV